MRRAEQRLRPLLRRRNHNATDPHSAMYAMIAIVVVEIATATATATVETAIATCVVMVHAMRNAAMGAHAETRRAVRAVAPAAMHRGQSWRLGRTNRLAKTSRRAKISRRGKIRLLVLTRHCGPISLRAPISLATKANGRLMTAASAASEEDETVDGADVVAGATAVKTMRMAPVPTQVQVRTQAPTAAQPPAKETWAANARQPHLLSNPSRRRSEIRRRSEMRLQHRPRRLRYAAPSQPPQAPAPERTTNTSCGPQPRAMFSAQDPRTGSATSAASIARRR